MNQTHFRDYYKDLEVESFATDEQIRQSYLKLAKKHHPDRGGSQAKMKSINEAYGVLHDQSLRNQYDAVYERYHEWLLGNKENDDLIQEVEYEMSLINQARKLARDAALKGLAWLVIGTIITAATYATADPGGHYFVAWGAMLIGGYQFLKGLYFYFDPYALIKKSLGNNTPANFRKKGQGVRALVKVSTIALVILIIVAAIMGSQNTSGTSSGDMESNGSASAESSGTSQDEQQLANLKSQYDNCVSEYNSLNSQIDLINSQMDNYQAYGNTYSYNNLVPQQNALVNQYNGKKTECENIRSQYNSIVDSHNAAISQ